MTDFFRGQMDYILFFYGLSFVILSVICFIMTRAGNRRLPWTWLGLFGITHGMNEWLDLLAGGLDQFYLFKVFSLLLLVFSFVALFEFGRAGTKKLRGRGPGRWIFIPLLAASAAGLPGGFGGVEASSGVLLGMPGGLLSAFVLFRFSRSQSRSARPWLTAGSVATALYSLMVLISGINYFSSVQRLNAAVITGLSGLPVGLFSGLLAFVIALSVWVYSQASSSALSCRGRLLKNTFLPVAALIVILSTGWVITETTGRQAKKEEIKEGALYTAMLSGRISDALDDTASTARSMAESPRIATALISGRPRDVAQARLALDECRNIEKKHAPFCYLFNSRGQLVASCGRAGESPDIPRYMSARFSPLGDYEFDSRAHKWYYRADAPVRDSRGRLIGTVVIRENLDEAEALMRNRPYAFFVNPRGLVFLSSNEKFCLKSLWPIDKNAEVMMMRSGKFGAGPFSILLKKEPLDGRYVAFGGKRFIVSRQSVGKDGWSVILLSPTRLVTAYRLFSIFTTFFFFSLTVGFFSLVYFTRASAEELRKAKEELEVRVEERSSELGYVNDELLREIAERKLSERALKISEEKYKNLIELTPDVIYLSDVNGHIIFINEACRRIFDASPEDVAGTSLMDWIHPEDRDMSSGKFSGVLRKGLDIFEFESRFVSASGRTVNVLFNIRAINNEKGDIIGTQGITRDITGRKKAERLIEKLNRRNQLILSSAGEGIYGVDLTGAATFVNPAARNMLGWTEEEMLGRSQHDLIHHSRADGTAYPRDECLIYAAFRRGKVYNVDSEVFWKKDGTPFRVEYVSTPIFEEGSIVGAVVIFRDIEERKRAEDGLRESEERFRSLFNLASDCILQLAPGENGPPVIVDINVSACEMHGYTREEMIGKPLTFLSPESSHRIMLDAVKRIMLGETMTFEVEHMRKSGIFFTVEVSAHLVYIGGAPYILAIDRDITERRKIEEALRERDRTQKAILNNIPDMAWLKDGECRFISTNEAFGKACGVHPEDLSGVTDFDIWPRHLAEKYRTDDIEVMKTGKGKQVEEELIDQGGRRIWMETIKTPIYNDNGEVIGTTGISRDITERKSIEEKLRLSEEELRRHREHLVEMVEERTLELQTAVQFLTQEIGFRKKAEETLKESEARFRELFQQFHTLLDAIPDVLLLLSSDLKVLWANSSAVSRLGGAVSDLKGRRCFELWHDSCDPCDDCHVIKTFRSGEAAISKRTAGGRLLDSRAFPIKDEEGRVKNAIVVISDITEKVTLEAEAMRASHLASLGELAAGVAHEINNPINGIINYAQMIVNRGAGTRENEIAGRIIREGNRIAGIVRSLLSFARERKEEKAAVNIRKILYETITLTEAQIRKDGIRLQMDCPESLPAVIANPQQLQQVFLNVISNARYALNMRYRATDEKKVLAISCRPAVVNDVPWLEITFLDHGTGIPTDIVERVMNPFFSTKPSGEGTGLGLSISHGIVKAHGGRLLVESVEGAFTKVSIHLPAEEEHGA